MITKHFLSSFKCEVQRLTSPYPALVVQVKPDGVDSFALEVVNDPVLLKRLQPSPLVSSNTRVLLLPDSVVLRGFIPTKKTDREKIELLRRHVNPNDVRSLQDLRPYVRKQFWVSADTVDPYHFIIDWEPGAHV